MRADLRPAISILPNRIVRSEVKQDVMNRSAVSFQDFQITNPGVNVDRSLVLSRVTLDHGLRRVKETERKPSLTFPHSRLNTHLEGSW